MKQHRPVVLCARCGHDCMKVPERSFKVLDSIDGILTERVCLLCYDFDRDKDRTILFAKSATVKP